MSSLGSVQWISPRAAELTAWGRQKPRQLPGPLAEGVRRLSRFLQHKRPLENPFPSISFQSVGGQAVRADFRLNRDPRGGYLILIELEDGSFPPLLEEIAQAFGLTKAETRVLGCISLGLSNREIQKRLFISGATVHTHAVRVLDKLGVQSRLQAALLVHGQKPETQSLI